MSTSPLDNLSDELRLIIIELLEQSDLLNLSSTYCSYRALLIPNIFRKVSLRNDEKSGLSMQEFLCSERKDYVKELHYKGVTEIPADYIMADIVDEEDEEEGSDKLEIVLSGPTRGILSNLKQFPNLKRLVVEFPWTEKDIDRGFYHFEEIEGEEQVEEREGEVAWRALMARTYEAIGENKDLSTVKSLEMRQVVARSVSTWWTADFRAFLGSLQSFSLSTIGMDNGAGWCLNTNDGYLDFLSELGDSLTNYLHNIKTLSIAGNKTGPIGCEGMRHAPSSLGVESMPKLRYLHLKYFFLDPPLIEFIEGRLETLETIVLDECLGTGDNTLAENGYGWKVLFDRIVAKKPTKLARFDLTWEHVDFPWEDDYQKIDQQSAKVKAGKASLKSGRRAFVYAHLDDKYGMLFQDDDENLEKMVEGEDFRAYCKLMDVVKGNAR